MRFCRGPGPEGPAGSAADRSGTPEGRSHKTGWQHHRPGAGRIHVSRLPADQLLLLLLNTSLIKHCYRIIISESNIATATFHYLNYRERKQNSLNRKFPSKTHYVSVCRGQRFKGERADGQSPAALSLSGLGQ